MDPALVAMPPPAMAPDDNTPWEYRLRKYLLLLATLVATVTYTAGFTPPGGVWEETDPAAGGHLAGDPILRQTNYHRYVVFFYLNAMAFASSLVTIMLILILSLRHERENKSLEPVSVLRGFMLLDLLSLIGAYAAGIYRERDVPEYTLVLAGLTVVYLVVFHMVRPCSQGEDVRNPKEREKLSKVLMLLATFAVSVTYLAGLSAPGGFRNKADGYHRPGDPVLMGGRHEMRLKIFVHLNSTVFFCSLLIAVQLLDKHLVTQGKVRSFRSCLFYASIIFALLGLVGAYATGSSRETDTTIYVTLAGAVPASILLFVILRCRPNDISCAVAAAAAPPPPPQTDVDKARSLVLLLATLAATITYQAGLDPPGGLWEKDGVDYKAGDPILLTTSPKRFKAFFYSNSVAFVASLLAIILVEKRMPEKRMPLETAHALQAAMILDLFGLIGAYAAGSCRDVSTSIYAAALAGAVLVYVVIHVLFFTLGHKTSGSDEKALEVVENRRKRLLLFAVLAATITYQAGLTPPGGFRTQGDEFGHHAGDPVLHYNSPPRYTAFFYCNSVSFMLSIAMIILLVNPNLYVPAIQSHAISVCTAAGMFSLVGAYAAGSTQHLRTSLKIFGLAAAILIVVVAVVLKFVPGDNVEKRPAKDTIPDRNEKKQHFNQKYLMLVGILGASVTYQVGLKPPGGMWQDDGNPVMHDNGRTRYLAFFYINSTSFVASIIVVSILLLLKLRHVEKWEWSLRAMNTTIVLDLLGLLVAYAVGSTRSWKTTRYVFALAFTVLVYIAIHIMLSRLSGGDGKNAPDSTVSPSNEEANGDDGARNV